MYPYRILCHICLHRQVWTRPNDRIRSLHSPLAYWLKHPRVYSDSTLLSMKTSLSFHCSQHPSSIRFGRESIFLFCTIWKVRLRYLYQHQVVKEKMPQHSHYSTNPWYMRRSFSGHLYRTTPLHHRRSDRSFVIPFGRCCPNAPSSPTLTLLPRLNWC